ncbi:MAG: ABC transporter permease, partial [Chloroflexi bacterium]|nr:ABC transporter permease [Chloroflexota bacterium]
VLPESVILTESGFVVGLAAAILLARLAEQMVPEFVTDFRALDLAGVLVAAGLMSVIASLAPIRRINGIDPAMVFRA